MEEVFFFKILFYSLREKKENRKMNKELLTKKLKTSMVT